MTNEELDAAIETAPTAALMTERSARIDAQLSANASAEAQYLATGCWPGDEEEVIRVSKLSPAAIEAIEDDYSRLEGPGAGDHFVEGKTFVETTRRVLSGALEGLDVDDAIELAMGNVFTDNDAHMKLAERNARKSIAATARKLSAALAI